MLIRALLSLVVLSLCAGCMEPGVLEISEAETVIVIEPVGGDAPATDQNSQEPPPDAWSPEPVQPVQPADPADPEPPDALTCPEGQGPCDAGACVDILENDTHCGACGNVCEAGTLCIGGACECEIGELCGAECVDTTMNTQHCGACNRACAAAQACVAGECVAVTEVDAVVAETNAVRAIGANCGVYGTFGPAPPLEGDSNLHVAAQNHANDMSSNDFFSHTGSDGSSFVDRIRRTSFSGQPIGENIAAGQRSALQAVQGWVESDGHCRNLMNPNATKIGVGFQTGGPYGTLWVQVFAR